MEFRTKVIIKNEGFNVHIGDSIMLLGSCFTENIGKILEDYKFNCDINPFGVLYNPLSISQALDIMLSGCGFPFNDFLFENNSLWNSWLHSSLFSAASQDKCINNVNERFIKCSDAIKSADALIITLGTNRCYKFHNGNQEFVVANCHKIPERRFTIHDAGIDEIFETFKSTLSRLFETNNHIQVLFTVSPYRYAKYGFHNSNLSKSTLLIAVDKIIKYFNNKCFYFPSYEIVNDELRDYRFYADDMLHPSQNAVNYIYECFQEFAFDKETKCFTEEWQKIIQAMKHRPIHTESDEYRKFLVKTQEHIIALSKKYTNLAISKEVNELNKRLLLL